MKNQNQTIQSDTTKEVTITTVDHTEPLVQSFDLSEPLPDLSTAREMPIDLSSTYWTPEKPGEFMRCFFQRIEPSLYTNEKTGEVIELPCVILIAQNEKKEITTIRNGSKRLVASIEEAVTDGRIVTGMPMIITYLGKKKNKTNPYLSDTWSVRPLIIS